MVVNVAAGQIAVPTGNNTGSMLCSSDAVEAVTVSAAPVGNNRIDLIVCQARGADVDGGANNDFVFAVVTGTAAASPVAPAVPANAVALAQIYVGSGVASIIAANITDIRPGYLSLATLGLPANIPRGTLAQAQLTANSGTTTGSLTVLTAPAFTTDGTRRIRASFCGWVNSSTANDTVGVSLMEGAATLQRTQARVPAAGGSGQVSAATFWQGVPAAGAHTYSLAVSLIAGTGPVLLAASAGVNPAFLLIEDIGT